MMTKHKTVNVDKDKLKILIDNEIRIINSDNSPWTDATILIGEIDGMQVQLRITSEEDDFLDSTYPDNECVVLE